MTWNYPAALTKVVRAIGIEIRWLQEHNHKAATGVLGAETYRDKLIARVEATQIFPWYALLADVVPSLQTHKLEAQALLDQCRSTRDVLRVIAQRRREPAIHVKEFMEYYSLERLENWMKTLHDIRAAEDEAYKQNQH